MHRRCCLSHFTVNMFHQWGPEGADSSWNVMAHGDVRVGKWRGNWRMQWVASTLHTTSEHGVYSITTADAHTSAASSRLNWRPTADLNGLVRFARKTKSGFCACAITFQTRSTSHSQIPTSLKISRDLYKSQVSRYTVIQLHLFHPQITNSLLGFLFSSIINVCGPVEKI